MIKSMNYLYWLWLFNKYDYPVQSLGMYSSVVVSLIINLASHWRSGTQVRRVPLCDWLDLGVKVKSTANADVDFCSKMASVTVVMQTNRSSSISSSKRRTGTMSQRRFRLLDNSVLLFLSLASMLHCALADGKTLVLLDNLNIRDTHSIFFRSLAGRCEIHACFIHNYPFCLVIAPCCSETSSPVVNTEFWTQTCRIGLYVAQLAC